MVRRPKASDGSAARPVAFTSEAAAQDGGSGGTPPPPPSGGNPSAGAMPSNTAPANSKEGPPVVQILRAGIDSLYLSFPGSLSVEASIKLRALKDAARSRRESAQAEAVYLTGKHRFEVMSKGAGVFPYVLADNAYRISIANSNTQQIPLAYVQVKSQWLTAHGVAAVVEELTAIAAEFGTLEGVAQVSRADLFVDFMTPARLDNLPPGSWVTRAKRISTHTLVGILSGFSIGLGGDISARLYDKTLQIESSGQDYLKALWYDVGWEPDQTVWRLEFQFERRVLVEHGAKDVDTLLSKLKALWLYATTQWLKLTVPNPEDATRARWPLHPMWTALTQASFVGSGERASIPVRTARVPSDHRLFVQGIAGVTTFMACRNIADPREAFERFYEEAFAYFEDRMMLMEDDLGTYMRKKAAIKGKLFNLPYHDIDERTDTLLTDAVAGIYRAESDGE